MDVNEFENQLNNFESNPEKLLPILINEVVKLRAYTETMFDHFVAASVSRLPEKEQLPAMTSMYEDFQVTLTKIQAEIAAKL